MIIGASGHGKVIADIALKMNKWQNIEFLDKNAQISECLGFKVTLDTDDYTKFIDDYEFIIAIGNNLVREKIMSKLYALGIKIATLIHPNAIIATDVNIMEGTVIMAGVVINSSSKIGKGCIINTSSSLDHDIVIEDYVHVSPGAHIAGSVHVGKGSWIGIGSIISNNITVCNDCIVGAGGVVIKDIVEAGTYVGVPVRRIG